MKAFSDSSYKILWIFFFTLAFNIFSPLGTLDSWAINDRLFRHSDFNRMANGSPNDRWILAQEATKRMEAFAAKLGIPKKKITQAIFHEYTNDRGNTIPFNPHIDDLEMAFEGLPVPAPYNPEDQNYGPTAYHRNKEWAIRYGGLSDRQLFKMGQWFHGIKTGNPAEWENPYLKGDGKWSYKDALALAKKNGPEGIKEFKAIMDDLRDSNNSPFAYFRLKPFYKNDPVNPRREYEYLRNRRYLPFLRIQMK